MGEGCRIQGWSFEGEMRYRPRAQEGHEEMSQEDFWRKSCRQRHSPVQRPCGRRVPVVCKEQPGFQCGQCYKGEDGSSNEGTVPVVGLSLR